MTQAAPPSRASQLAQKLISEGERTTTFFSGLPAEVWGQPLYPGPPVWHVRDALEHLVLAEQSLREMIRNVSTGGPGAPVDFDIDRFNHENLGRLAGLDRDALLAQYSTTREDSAAFAATLSEAQLEQRGRHPAMGDSAVSDMLKMLYLHNTLHIKDIKKLLG
jgi:DinB superfamily